MSELYNHDDETKLSALLVGRRIVSVSGYESGRLILDDGTELELEGNEGCGGCPAGHYNLTHLGRVDNVITRVWIEKNPSDDFTDEGVYKIFVYAGDEQINLATFEGDDGNGYYGTGFTVSVRRPLKCIVKTWRAGWVKCTNPAAWLEIDEFNKDTEYPVCHGHKAIGFQYREIDEQPAKTSEN